jgi:hypothetical protein
MNILLSVLMTLAQANEAYTADIYDLDGKEKLFTLSTNREFIADAMTYTATFKDMTGAVVGEEKVQTKNGVLVSCEVVRPLVKEKGLIEVKDGKIHFTYTEDGKTSQAKTQLKPDVLVSGTLVPFMESRLKDLLEKKEVTFGYAVWFRKEVMGFKFSYEKEEANNIVVKMIPTNFLYRSLVNPLYFTMDKTTKKLISIKGRSLPKIKKDGSWRDFDGFTKYN